MSEEVLYFFSGHEGALPIYHALEDQLTAMLPDLEIKVQQTRFPSIISGCLPAYPFCRCEKRRIGRKTI